MRRFSLILWGGLFLADVTVSYEATRYWIETHRHVRQDRATIRAQQAKASSRPGDDQQSWPDRLMATPVEASGRIPGLASRQGEPTLAPQQVCEVTAQGPVIYVTVEAEATSPASQN